MTTDLAARFVGASPQTVRRRIDRGNRGGRSVVGTGSRRELARGSGAPPSRLALRVGGLGGVAAGTAYAAAGVADLLAPTARWPGWPGPVILASSYDYLVQFSLVAALLGTLVAIAGLYVARRRNYGWAWTVGSSAAFYGHALLLYDASETAARGATPATGPSLVSWGILLALVGLVLLGTATLDARALPRWCGLLLLFGFPTWALPEDSSWWGGWLLLGSVWASVGFALLPGRGISAGRTSRAGRAPENSPKRLRGAGSSLGARGTATRRPRRSRKG